MFVRMHQADSWNRKLDDEPRNDEASDRGSLGQDPGRVVSEIDDAIAAGRGSDVIGLYRVALSCANTELAGRLARRAISAGLEAEALLCLQVMAANGKNTAEQSRSISSLFLSLGRVSEACPHAHASSDLNPRNAEYALHAGVVSCVAERHREAVRYLLRNLRLAGPSGITYRHLAVCYAKAQRFSRAKILGRIAVHLDPTDITSRMECASLLISQGVVSDGASLLRSYCDLGKILPREGYLLLAKAYQEMGDWVQALEAASGGLSNWPADQDLLLQRGTLLCLLARYDEAVVDFRYVLSSSPRVLEAKRGLFAALTESGKFIEATKVGAELVAEAPEDKELGSTLHYVLNRRFVESPHEERDVVSRAHDPMRLDDLASASPVRSVVKGTDTQIRIIIALMRREMLTRFGRTRLGYSWALLEPAIHITILSIVIGVTVRGVSPVGDSYAIMYFTGVMPYQLFLHTSSQIAAGVPANRPLLQIPLVTPLDVFMSRALLEFATHCAVCLILFLGFFVLEMASPPIDALGVIIGLSVVWLFAVGVGIFNALVATTFQAWERIWTAVLAILYFTSGIFYLPALMPEWLREILQWNPILQGIEQVRSSFFPNYEPPWRDLAYASTIALLSITGGIVLERLFRRRLLNYH